MSQFLGKTFFFSHYRCHKPAWTDSISTKSHLTARFVLLSWPRPVPGRVYQLAMAVTWATVLVIVLVAVTKHSTRATSRSKEGFILFWFAVWEFSPSWGGSHGDRIEAVGHILSTLRTKKEINGGMLLSSFHSETLVKGMVSLIVRVGFVPLVQPFWELNHRQLLEVGFHGDSKSTWHDVTVTNALDLA